MTARGSPENGRHAAPEGPPSTASVPPPTAVAPETSERQVGETQPDHEQSFGTERSRAAVLARNRHGRKLVPTIVGAGAVLIASSVLHLWGLDKAPFHTKGEPREALVVQEILSGGGWVLPRRNGVQIPSKPPMFHWLAALTSFAVQRTDERSIRLPSAALSAGSALVVYMAGVSFCGVRAGTLAALSLLSCFEWTRAATSARVDMTLTFGLTLSFVSLLFLRRADRTCWRVIFYFGAVWAILSKGIAAGTVPLVGIVLVASALDRSLVLLRRLKIPKGVPLVLGLAGAWYLLAWHEGGEAFVAKQIWSENVLRVLGGSAYRGGHVHSPARLLLELAAGLLPWTLFLPLIVRWLWSSRAEPEGSIPRFFLGAWILVILLPYMLATGKRGVYLLPLYPAYCLLLGAAVDSTLRAGLRAEWLRAALTGLGWLLAVVAGGVIAAIAAETAGLPVLTAVAVSMRGETIAHVDAIARAARQGPLSFLIPFSVLAISATITATAAAARKWVVSIAAVLVSTGAVVVCVQNAILPAVAWQKTRRNYVATVRAMVPTPDRLCAYRNFDYGFVFYWGRHLPICGESRVAQDALYLLVKEGTWEQIKPIERASHEVIPAGSSGRSGNVGRLLLVRRVLTETAPPFTGAW